MPPDDFASKIIITKISDLDSPKIEHLNLPKDTRNRIYISNPTYTFEISLLALYYAYKSSKLQNQEISYENIVNFAIKSGVSGIGIFVFGIDKNIVDKFKLALRNSFDLYENKTDYEIKNIYLNLCNEEIKEQNLVIKKFVSSDTVAGMPLYLEHFNKVFANKDLYLLSELIFKYINHNKEKFKTPENNSYSDKL